MTRARPKSEPVVTDRPASAPLSKSLATAPFKDRTSSSLFSRDILSPHRKGNDTAKMFSPLLTVFLAIFVALVRAQDNPAFPSNTSSYAPASNASQQVVLGLQAGPNGYNDPPIFALTQKAFNNVDHGPNANGNTGLGIALVDASAPRLSNLTKVTQGQPIAYINCDPDAWTGNIGQSNAIQAAISANASAVVFYDTMAPFCNLTSNLTDAFNAFGMFYTMTNAMTSQQVLRGLGQSMTPGIVGAEILTSQAYINVQNRATSGSGFGDPTPGTAVAMIILYSITGVIALLFVVIIVTGAVRAHRHPERYGPRQVAGRPVRTRAQGIGRAMLETLPLVKFGEATPAKSTDVEMQSQEGQTGASTEATEAGKTEHTTDSPAKTADGTTTNAAAAGEAAAAATRDPAQKERVEKSLECAICWEDFERGEEVRVLPCEHKFHPKCIDPWLLDFSGTCPVCRVDFAQKGQPEPSSTASNTEGASRS